MSVKREVLTVVFGAILTAFFLQLGWMSRANPFWDNVIAGLVVMIGSRVLGRILGGR